MKVFYCTDHKTHYPVGGSSVVVAQDEEQARQMLKDALKLEGLGWRGDEQLVELNTSVPGARVLDNGDY
jgi:hypothetical protein